MPATVSIPVHTVVNERLQRLFHTVCFMYLLEIVQHGGRNRLVCEHLRQRIAELTDLTEDEVVEAFTDMAAAIERQTRGRPIELVETAMAAAQKYAEET